MHLLEDETFGEGFPVTHIVLIFPPLPDEYPIDTLPTVDVPVYAAENMINFGVNPMPVYETLSEAVVKSLVN